MEIKGKKTQRGFTRYEFSDAYSEACSLQESSAADDEGFIWLGINKVVPKFFTPGVGWRDVPLPASEPGQNLQSSARMHLSQSQVAALMPYLVYFIENGDLPMVLPDGSTDAR